jgi:hypothetical protein
VHNNDLSRVSLDVMTNQNSDKTFFPPIIPNRTNVVLLSGFLLFCSA